MSLIDEVLAELPRMRAEAESLMLDTGTAKRPTGGTVYDPVTQTQAAATTDLFVSPCKIQARTLAAEVEEVGGRTATTVRLELHLPASTAPLTTGDLFAVTAVSSLSTAVVGRTYRVVAPHEKSWPTARRYDVEAVVS